ncbi:thiopeptide-type bacteriocin biosynthesis protein [Chryseobacterium sp. C-39]|uniref:Thiopeptide-type bacteriocin biosynthesis protein n=1 Tax=Chryseobacterium muglaense TaxID=2893752 RepID=A0A9Q3YPU4_9FLAO|nr:thiopeptide-type bacteriocin biosynthesis protein [Chryseobacterium muglaense]MBD3907114.1 hypothetical protein [Chryseobacterium muglaense]MCC9033129.1 thiopeptide-type bacteriocin biosynthesis protein [Chryseobacterium muglaense]
MQTETNWISAYIFHDISFEKVLIELLKPFIEKLEKKDYVSTFFFIRYWEDGPHVRLRLLPKNSQNKAHIISLLKTTVKLFFDECSLVSSYRLEFKDYVREIERYGGKVNIIEAEKIFEISSRTILDIIDDNYNNWDYSLAISYAIQIHLVLAKLLFKNDLNTMISFFQKVYSNWFYYSIKIDETEKKVDDEVKKINLAFEESYNKQNTVINNMIKYLLQEKIEVSISTKWFLESNLIDNNYYSFKNCDDLTLFAIYDSLIHMTNNRLGIYLRDESFIAFLIFNGLIKYKNSLS